MKRKWKRSRTAAVLIITITMVLTSVMPSYAAEFTTLNQAVIALRDALLARQTEVVMAIDSPVDFTMENATRDYLLYPAFSEDIANTITAGGYLRGVWSRHSYIIRRAGTDKWQITFTNIQYKTTLEQEARCMEKLEEVMDELDVWPLSDYMKYRTIYSYVTEQVNYDYDAYQDFLDSGGSADGHETAYTAYGALVEGKAVCQGYAALFYLMCRYAGLPVVVLTGQAVGSMGYENHAWNMIQLDGKWYQVDATWDEGKPVWQQRYFARGTSDFTGHILDMEFMTEDFHNRYGLAEDDYIVTEKDLERVCRFRDVSEDDYFYYPAWELSEQGVISGTNKYTFSPYLTMNRGMMVTLLYRMAGAPEPEGENLFADVPEDAWYRDAVVWALEDGLTNGIGEDLFGPEMTLTREQLATFLYRYEEITEEDEGLPEEEIEEGIEEISDEGSDVETEEVLSEEGYEWIESFDDADDISDYARPAMNWAVEQGIIRGMPENRIEPGTSANRAQAATMLYRYLGL